ncbi:hypothetical protein GNI_113190 [Gregarina niphandrodes]|uniref:Uncharacterized protein n=1 Tax=Gregarina niphandrodes TaxID=110365 RepID=A0A023B399_GRENI|nr:hypothetical protein GNI_113190 [Gregarina niphandrodes]EZG55420.1 hypothetical protein GNI_113190 [Gregarina niphandrodes]|eukprot:XP_011131560.1 hypothetical protein GNI_113190 [Gregarina niphandrodes]
MRALSARGSQDVWGVLLGATLGLDARSLDVEDSYLEPEERKNLTSAADADNVSTCSNFRYIDCSGSGANRVSSVLRRHFSDGIIPVRPVSEGSVSEGSVSEGPSEGEEPIRLVDREFSNHRTLATFAAEHSLTEPVLLTIVLESLKLLRQCSRGKFSSTDRKALNEVLQSKYLPRYMRQSRRAPYLTGMHQIALDVDGHKDLRNLSWFGVPVEPSFRLRLQPCFGQKKHKAMRQTGKAFVDMAIKTGVITCPQLAAGFGTRCRRLTCRQEHKLEKVLAGGFRNFRQWCKAVSKYHKKTIGVKSVSLPTLRPTSTDC